MNGNVTPTDDLGLLPPSLTQIFDGKLMASFSAAKTVQARSN